MPPTTLHRVCVDNVIKSDVEETINNCRSDTYIVCVEVGTPKSAKVVFDDGLMVLKGKMWGQPPLGRIITVREFIKKLRDLGHNGYADLLGYHLNRYKASLRGTGACAGDTTPRPKGGGFL